MPNVMAALTNIGGALCSTSTTIVACSNAAKTQKPLKFVGVPQTSEPISTVTGPMFAILWRHVEEILLFNRFFPIVDTFLSCEDFARERLCDGAQMAIFASFFASCISSEPRAAHLRPAF